MLVVKCHKLYFGIDENVTNLKTFVANAKLMKSIWKVHNPQAA